MRRGARPAELLRIDAAIGNAVVRGFSMTLLPHSFRTAITVEVMNRNFTKYHLGGGFALHHFKGVDLGPPHDHPCDFTTLILAPYVEDVYTLTNDGWSFQRVRREAGSAHTVAASTIHKIVALPEGSSWTLVHYGPHQRDTHFYKFGEIVETRTWRQRKWRLVEPRAQAC